MNVKGETMIPGSEKPAEQAQPYRWQMPDAAELVSHFKNVLTKISPERKDNKMTPEEEIVMRAFADAIAKGGDDDCECQYCAVSYNCTDGNDPSALCHNCAQEASAFLPALLSERDAARAEAAMYRALMPEVRQILTETADWRNLSWELIDKSKALLAKLSEQALPPEEIKARASADHERSWYHAAIAEREDLRAKLAVAEKERDSWKDSAERHHADGKGLMRQRESLEINLETAKGMVVKASHEHDAARAELATLRALMPEVRRVCEMARFVAAGTEPLTSDATALLAKMPQEPAAEPKAVREWRFEHNDFWAEYRFDGTQRWYREKGNPGWEKVSTTIEQIEQTKCYRETTPQPATGSGVTF